MMLRKEEGLFLFLCFEVFYSLVGEECGMEH